MNRKPNSCEGCPLHSRGIGFCSPEGSGTNRVLIVGDALGAYEAKDGLPFRPWGEVGSVLERAIVSLGMTRNQFVLYSLVACQPPGSELLGTPFEFEAITHCNSNLEAIVNKFRPKVILALGVASARTLTGLSGEKLSIDHIQGFVLPSIIFPGIKVVCSYSPAYIMRGAWEVFPILRNAIKKAVNVAFKLQNGTYREESLDYIEEGTIDQLKDLRKRLIAEPERTLSYDFETQGEDQEVPSLLGDDEGGEGGEGEDYETEGDEIAGRRKKKQKISVFQQITQVNFTVEVGTGIAVQLHRENSAIVRSIFALPNPKVGHNVWNFDNAVAAFNGIEIGGGLPDDTIWSFHHLYPDLPGRKGKVGVSEQSDKDMGSLAPLQFAASLYNFPFPWKHFFKEKPGFYGCCDSDAALRVHLGVSKDLQSILCDDRTGQTAWDGYCEMVHAIQPIFEEMNRRGIPVNRERLVAFTRKMREESRKVYARMMREYVPQEILQPQHKLGLKKVPKLSEEELAKQGYVKKSFILLEEEKCSCSKKVRERVCWACKQEQKRKTGKLCQFCNVELLTVFAPDPDCQVCAGKGLIRGEVERWTKLKPFKTSPSQLKNYALYRGHEIPKNSRKVRAMDKENLLRMEKRYRDPLYASVIEFREYQKLASTYGEGWMPWEDGCVHPTFGFTPATGQSSSTGPNAQNRPNPGKMGQLAHEFSLAIEAPEGFSLVEFDFKSFHAKTLGLESGDQAYIRLAGLDMHSYLTAFLLKLPDREKALQWGDKELGEWLNWIKKNHKKMRDKNAKPAILGYGFGLGAEKLWAMNRDSFRDKRDAQFVIDTLDATFPITAQYRKDRPELAHRQKRLTTRFGAVRWFWNVKGWDVRKRQWTHGKDWERTIAFCPAANAFGHKKAIMRSLWDQGLTERYGLINDIHDALMFLCPNSLVEECLHTVKGEMESESKVLILPNGRGFSCEVEQKVGRNWAEMQEVEVK